MCVATCTTPPVVTRATPPDREVDNHGPPHDFRAASADVVNADGVAQSPQPAATAQDVAQPTAPVEVHTTFRVRYVNGANVYVEGGRSAGLAEGTRLVVRAGAASTTAPILG